MRDPAVARRFGAGQDPAEHVLPGFDVGAAAPADMARHPLPEGGRARARSEAETDAVARRVGAGVGGGSGGGDGVAGSTQSRGAS